MKEIWKDIKGFKGLYQISNLGRVKSLKKKRGFLILKEKILKSHLDNLGYQMLTLVKNKKHKQYRIHRLVAIAFISNLNNKKEVNHIDGNKSNNNILNLEWSTRSENMKHADKMGLRNINGENNNKSKLKNENIIFIRKNKNKYSQKELAFLFNVTNANICSILKNKTWRHICA